MAKKETTSHAAPMLPMLKTVEQMSSCLPRLNVNSKDLKKNVKTSKNYSHKLSQGKSRIKLKKN